ncbi:MAG: hypothetical protein QME52_03335 [Bacteroidota bacterium]|nr:hypothetical protein [Bacteroidota bacterium]
MLDTKITEEVRKLSVTERLALLEFTFALLKEDLQRKKSEKKAESRSFTWIASCIADAGENAIHNGAPILPVDFASNHDTYLYNKS